MSTKYPVGGNRFTMTDEEGDFPDPHGESEDLSNSANGLPDEVGDLPEEIDDLFDGTDDADHAGRSFKPPAAMAEALQKTAGTLLLKYLDPPWLESDRPRGVLSKTDREFLLGQKDYAHNQSRANRKQTIRERIEHSLYDFTLLWLVLPPRERERVITEMDDTDANASMEALITFVYLSLDQDVAELESRIERGVLAGASYDPDSKEDGQVTNVDVSIDIDHQPRVDELKTKLQEQADGLTPEEIGILARVGELEPEDLEALEESRTESVYSGGGGEGVEENDSSG